MRSIFEKKDRVFQSLDYVVASHVIEHVPDLVTWLQEIRSVLVPHGELRLAVPDKRYTFDYLRRVTQIDSVLVAYLNRARIPNTQCLLDFCLNEVAVNTVTAWQGELDVSRLKKAHTIEGAMHVARDALENGTYHDVHCWVFTPASFASLFVELAKANLIDFACTSFFEPIPNTNEFIVNMRVDEDKSAVVASWQQMAERVGLAERQAAELAAESRLLSEREKERAQQSVIDATVDQAKRTVERVMLDATHKREIGIRSAWKAVVSACRK